MATMLRDSHTASNNFRLSSQDWDGVPKPGFLYYIRFVRADSSGSSGVGSSGNDWSKGLGVLAKEIDRPKVSFETDVLNQYNRKRIVQKRVTYDPVSFTFWDTVDNKAAHMFEDYFRFYYGDPRNSSATAWSWDIMSAMMNQGASGWGFQPPTSTAQHSFFSHIEFYLMYGGKYTRYDIINPRFRSFDPSSMEYADSGGATISMTFEYEGVIYQGNNKSLSDENGLIQEMGLAGSGFYEPRTDSGSGAIGAAGNSYSKTAGDPFYGSSILKNLSNATIDSVGSIVNKSSSVINNLFNQTTVLSGIVTNTAQSVAGVITGLPTIGDNIPKKLVEGQKDHTLGPR
jgi:hypothetical protein